MKRVLLLALIPPATVACNSETSTNSLSRYEAVKTAADSCLEEKVTRLSAIDHETPGKGAVRELVEFCERQYPNEPTQTPGAEPLEGGEG